MIRWLRKRPSSNDHLVVSWSGHALAYVLARRGGSNGYQVLRSGVERVVDDQGPGAPNSGLDALVRKLKTKELDGFQASVMLRPEQYQLLRIRTPAVPPDELRAAARYQVVKMLDTPVDDVTIDVMGVGDGRSRGAGHLAGHLFVVAAKRTVIASILDLSKAMQWTVAVIDIQEMAQRNLQSALAIRESRGLSGRANAALVLLDSFHAVLTICADGELFYARRFDLPKDFLASAWEANEDDSADRFLLEVQRSLDLWDRMWVSLPLDRIWLYAGTRSEALASWLTQQLGQTVQPMDIAAEFPEFKTEPVSDEALCLPLLGLMLRTEGRSS